MSAGQLGRMKIAACALAVLLTASGAVAGASAQEAIQTGPGGADAPPSAPASAAPATVADPDNGPAANGAWARRVLSGQKAEPERTADDGGRRRGCPAPPDRKPHGEVHAGVGTGGYREVGGAVTQPIGDCGSVTIAVDKTEFDGGRRGRR